MKLKRFALPQYRPLKTKGYIVLGMHRSGTSCLTGLLETCGLTAGNVSRSNAHNLKGNQEDPRVIRSNDRILKEQGGLWSKPPDSIRLEEINPNKVRKALEPFRHMQRWVIKDPRMLLTLDAWLPHIPNHHFIGSFRHPDAVAHSIRKRNSSFSIEECSLLWERYVGELVARHRQQAFPLINFDLSHEQYLLAFKALCHQLDLPYNDSTARSFYSDELITNRNNLNEAPQRSQSHTLYQYLLDHQIEPWSA